MSTSTDRFGRLHLVTVPITDEDAAIAFYAHLGFTVRVDQPFRAGRRWLELFPPDGTAGIALVPGDGGGGDTGIIVTTDDIDAAHAELTAAGVDVDTEIARPGGPGVIRFGVLDVEGPAPAMFRVRDADGNALLVVT